MIRSVAAALPAVLLAAPACALTPEEIWAEWQATAAGWGVTLAAEAAAGPGGALTLRNWTAGMAGGPPEPMPDDFPVREVTLRPAEGGAVEIDLGLPTEGVVPDTNTGMSVMVEQDGLRVLARDETDGTRYEVDLPWLRAASIPDDLTPGDALDDPMDFAFEVAGFTASFPGGPGPDRTVDASLALDGFAYVAGMSDPFTGESSSQSGRTQGAIRIETTVTLPEGMELSEMGTGAGFARALAGGFAVGVVAETGEVTQGAWVEGWPFSYATESVAEPGTFDLRFDGAGLAMTGAYGSSTLTATSDLLPFPQLDVAVGPFDLDLRVPFGAEVGEFRLLYALDDVTVNEEAWAAIDPAGGLPRGPARLALDVGGRAAIDLDAAIAAEAMGAAPYVPTIETLEVRELAVDIAGVRATGTGSFTFDDASGVPMPLGTGEVRLEGVDRLLDALVAAGYVTAEDAGNARLGLAAAFRPGDAPDSRVATFEALPGGRMLLNGVEVQ